VEDDPPTLPRGLVCLTPAQQGDFPSDSGHGMVSELAAWLHSHEWPVELFPATSRNGRLKSVDDEPRSESPSKRSRFESEQFGQASPEVLGMGFRIRRRSPWVVHAFDLDDAAAAQVANSPYVLSLREVPLSEGFIQKPRAYVDFQIALEGARRVTCTSRVAARRLSDTFGYESSVVPEGVDTETLSVVPERRIRPLIVCPLVDVTSADLQMLVDCFVEVAATVRDVQLAIVGRLNSRLQCQLIQSVPAELRSQLLVIENADRKRFLSLLGRAFVTCMPSMSESANRTLVESLAVGTPVVCADGGAGADVIDEDAVAAGAGLRFPAGDSDACIASIKRMIELATSEGLADRCRARASLYDWSFVGPLFVDLYRQAAD
jgi:glycosyltransferase involved in cell wall biosynthesis